MYVIARTDAGTGAPFDWLLEFSLKGDQIRVTRTRQNARHFKSEKDAYAVLDLLLRMDGSYNWRVMQV